jgi:hypothetical protein
MAIVHKKLAKFHLDEVYIGTPEERVVAAKFLEDADELALREEGGDLETGSK